MLTKQQKPIGLLAHTYYIYRPPMSKAIQITAVIIAYNEERVIRQCIASVRRIADEIIVVDSHSTDQTAAIATEFGARVIQQPFLGYAAQKNLGNDAAAHDWIFSIDADEAISPELEQCLLSVKNDARFDIYQCARLNNYCGKWLKHSGWYPDKKIRLFNRHAGKWAGDNIHETWEPNDKNARIGHLKGDLLHYSFPTITSHVRKIEFYSEAIARYQAEQGKDSSIFQVLFTPGWHFFVSYIIKLGILDGYYGYVVCKLSAHLRFLKHIKRRFYARQIRHGNYKKTTKP